MIEDLWKAVEQQAIKEEVTVALLINQERYLSPDDPLVENDLLTTETPETALVTKDLFQKLSWEAKQLATIIISLPEELFLANGKLRKEAFCKRIMLQMGWKKDKTQSVLRQMQNCLKT